MPLSEKEKKKIDEIETAVREKTPVEKLNADRKIDLEIAKAAGCESRLMGDMIPLSKRRPGLEDALRDAADGKSKKEVWTTMGFFWKRPKHHEEDKPSDETGLNRPDPDSQKKDKHDKNENAAPRKGK
jgi:hypothetical protein